MHAPNLTQNDVDDHTIIFAVALTQVQQLTQRRRTNQIALLEVIYFITIKALSQIRYWSKIRCSKLFRTKQEIPCIKFVSIY